MNSSRLNQLLDFLKEDPNDPFTIYAIATEYRFEEIEKSRMYYEQLLMNHPDYLPTYYHVAQLYQQLELTELAKQTFEKGIELAKKQENSLSLRELQNAYNELLFEEDE
ncbi:tetratricopeptide repeat protein [Fulvivirga sp. 29W222]|uniref:Tetratricopeptide repeat protein n=1 Tax=Fulvivirga marina TaxID=2494733 RepID=A0A937KH09_9BACT|nr:tetratricopeptide repeat protein [Fulvivirga marina]MBL6450020.1 tetratricopeptide repeat protein [Fulvivirga marina]